MVCCGHKFSNKLNFQPQLRFFLLEFFALVGCRNMQFKTTKNLSFSSFSEWQQVHQAAQTEQP